MEDIKTNLDQIMARFNDSVTHSPPRKLHFESFNYSGNGTGAVLSKKRRLELTNSSSLDSNTASPNSTVLNNGDVLTPSPWESRRLKADLIESKTIINKLKQEIVRQQRVHDEIKTLCENKVAELKKQCDYSADKAADMERHLQVLRKREQSAKQELIRMQKELNQQKNAFDEVILSVQRGNLEAQDKFRQLQNNKANELSDEHRQSEKLQLELDLATEELKNARKQLQSMEGRAAAYDLLKLKYETDRQELECALSRIKSMENEIASHNDWKEIIQSSQTRLWNIPEINKELELLKENNKQLQDLLGNKLLLEEEVHSLQTDLKKEAGASKKLVALKVEFEHMECELRDWVRVAQDHCLPNMVVSPMALRSRIEQILQNDIVVVSEKNSKLSEAKCKEAEMFDYKQKCEMYARNIEELNTALRRHKNFRERVQKKLLLVSKERDCYKNLIETFEKDLTGHTEVVNPDAYLHTRLEASEKTLSGYKEMCINLERELASCKQVTTADQGNESTLPADGYEYLKRELNTLRMENERIRRRKEELELELEQRCLKGDVETEAAKYKVVHYANNPAAEAYASMETVVEKLQAEIGRLKRRNQQLEDDNEITQARLAETMNMTINIKEVNQLQADLEAANAKSRKIKDCYKAANMEFREVCYLLFGYRIDRIGLNSNYKLSSLYAESADDYLNFRLNESNVLDMLETPYSITLKPLIESQLAGNKSLPAFLSALTLELFQRSTVTIN